MKRTLKIAAIFLPLLALAACGDFEASEGENYGDILATVQGLTLTEEEHGIGWGEANCFLCHQADNIHRTDRSAGGILDVAAIRQQIRDEGVSACSGCHGTNGVP